VVRAGDTLAVTKLDGLARSVPTLVRLPMSSPHGRSSNIGGTAYDPTYPIGGVAVQRP
jgi:hypothetical protein